MNISELENIKNLIQKAEVEQAKQQGVKDSIKSEWKKKYGFETLDEAEKKLNELISNFNKNEKKKETLMNELLSMQDWEEIESELED